MLRSSIVRAFQIPVLFCGLLAGGCAAKPVDISDLSTADDLEKYVGQVVTFTGRYQLTKETEVSNGKLSIGVRTPSGGAFNLEETMTVRGVLRKVAHQRPTDAGGESVIAQQPPPGVGYYIQTTTATDAGMKEYR